MSVGERWFYGVVAHRFEGEHPHPAFSRLKNRLIRAVALNLRRRGVHPHQLEGDFKCRPVSKPDVQYARCLLDGQRRRSVGFSPDLAHVDHIRLPPAAQKRKDALTWSLSSPFCGDDWLTESGTLLPLMTRP